MAISSKSGPHGSSSRSVMSHYRKRWACHLFNVRQAFSFLPGSGNTTALNTVILAKARIHSM
jgi:hypothetical protein